VPYEIYFPAGTREKITAGAKMIPITEGKKKAIALAQALGLAFTEPEAAVPLGVRPHVLRDCRRRGELQGAKVGSKIVYTRADLLDFLERQKENC
jgi:hypothetical protein